MFAKKIMSVFGALSFIFVADAFAKKRETPEDRSGQTKASQRLARRAEAQRLRQVKANQKNALKQRAQSKKSSKPDRNLQKQQQAQLRANRKQTTPVSRPITAKPVTPLPLASKPAPTPPAPKVFKEPTAYYVNVKDLSPEEKKQASKLIGLQTLSKDGTIKFAHPALTDQNASFQNFLNAKAVDKAQTGKTNAFERLEYKDSATSITHSSSRTSTNSSTSTKDKKSNWKWPWNK